MQIAEYRTFGARIGWIVKTYDYINYVVIMLPLTVYKGTWITLFPLIAIHHLAGSCVCVGIILKLLHSPTVASEPGLCVDVICTSRTQRSCGRGYIHIACRHKLILDSAVLLVEAAQTDITRTFKRDWFYGRASHTCGWWVSVSPTLVESDSMNMVLSEDKKQSLYRVLVFDA